MFEQLGLQQTPWVIRVYLVLLLIFAVLVLVAHIPGLTNLWGLASKGLETVLAALLGALSALASNRVS